MSPHCSAQLWGQWAPAKSLMIWQEEITFFFFFFTLILDVHSWFDFKGTLSESVQWVVEKILMGKTHFCWIKLTFCQCLDTLHIFSVRDFPYAYVVCWLRLFHFSCLILSPRPLFAKAGVSNALIPPPLTPTTTTTTTAAAAFQPCIIEHAAARPQERHQVTVPESGSAVVDKLYLNQGQSCSKTSMWHISICW